MKTPTITQTFHYIHLLQRGGDTPCWITATKHTSGQLKVVNWPVPKLHAFGLSNWNVDRTHTETPRTCNPPKKSSVPPGNLTLLAVRWQQVPLHQNLSKGLFLMSAANMDWHERVTAGTTQLFLGLCCCSLHPKYILSSILVHAFAAAFLWFGRQWAVAVPHGG